MKQIIFLFTVMLFNHVCFGGCDLQCISINTNKQIIITFPCGSGGGMCSDLKEQIINGELILYWEGGIFNNHADGFGKLTILKGYDGSYETYLNRKRSLNYYLWMHQYANYKNGKLEGLCYTEFYERNFYLTDKYYDNYSDGWPLNQKPNDDEKWKISQLVSSFNSNSKANENIIIYNLNNKKIENLQSKGLDIEGKLFVGALGIGLLYLADAMFGGSSESSKSSSTTSNPQTNIANKDFILNVVIDDELNTRIFRWKNFDMKITSRYGNLEWENIGQNTKTLTFKELGTDGDIYIKEHGEPNSYYWKYNSFKDCIHKDIYGKYYLELH